MLKRIPNITSTFRIFTKLAYKLVYFLRRFAELTYFPPKLGKILGPPFRLKNLPFLELEISI